MNVLPLFILSAMSLYQVKDEDKAYQYHHAKSDYYFHKGNYPEMLYHLQQKVKYNPKDVNTWSDLGYYYWSLGVDDKKRGLEFKDKAFRLLMQGLRANEESFFMWDEVGRFFIYSHKDYISALPFLAEAIKRPDCTSPTYHSLAEAYVAKNDFKSAIETLGKCLNKFPDDALAKRKLNDLRTKSTGS